LSGFYEQLKPLANFGPEFQRLLNLRGNENEALAEVATFAKDSGSVSLIYCSAFIHRETTEKAIVSILLRWMLVCITLCIQFFCRILRKEQRIFPSRLGSLRSTKISRLVNPYTRISSFSSGPLVSGIVDLLPLELNLIFDTEIRLADITVCNNVGTVLCKIEGMELHKVSTISHTIKTRFDLLPQPVIVEAELPEYVKLWRRPDKEETDNLGNVVDHLSVDIIKNSLNKSDLVVGEEVCFIEQDSVWIHC
jgi:hypothetical protein